jgi:hypothetical protein
LWLLHDGNKRETFVEFCAFFTIQCNWGRGGVTPWNEHTDRAVCCVTVDAASLTLII